MNYVRVQKFQWRKQKYTLNIKLIGGGYPTIFVIFIFIPIFTSFYATTPFIITYKSTCSQVTIYKKVFTSLCKLCLSNKSTGLVNLNACKFLLVRTETRIVFHHFLLSPVIFIPYLIKLYLNVWLNGSITRDYSLPNLNGKFKEVATKYSRLLKIILQRQTNTRQIIGISRRKRLK